MEKSITDMGAKFVFVGGIRAGNSVSINKESYFIGRSKNNNLVLEDRSVSRKHAVINYLDGLLVISDLNSFKGVYINSQRVQEASLGDGDRIKIGDILMEFQCAFMEGRGHRRKKKRSPFIFIVLGLILTILAGFFIFKVASNGAKKKLASEVEYNYSQGIKAYNVDKDTEAAMRFWQKVIELDPNSTMEASRKARSLLNNLKSNTGLGESR